MSELFDDSLISDFVAESIEHLDSIEPDMLAMEREGANVSSDIINGIFRAIHSIKGGAGFLAFERFKNLSHVMEGVLMQIRDGELSITPDITDVLLSGVDKLRVMVDDIQESENVECDDEVQRLTNIMEGNSGGEAASATSGEDRDLSLDVLSKFSLSTDELKEKVSPGHHLFAVDISLYHNCISKDVSIDGFKKELGSMGECIVSTMDLDALSVLMATAEDDVPFTILFSTVLEESMIGAALGVDDDCVTEINLKAQSSVVESSESVVESSASEPELIPVSSAPSPSPSSATPEKGSSQGGVEVAETLRVKVSHLSSLMNMAGELVLARNQLMRSAESSGTDQGISSAVLQNIDMVTTEIQEGIMQTRMQPVGAVFGKFPRVVRDLSRQLGKEIDLDTTGSEVELDKSIIELLGDPLTHIIRNCCDHALETPEEREAAGKGRRGTIELKAYHEGGQVNISILDDGRGIHPDKVVQKAIENGVLTAEQAEKMSPREKVNLVFAAGFSMAKEVSDLSGRGVGMDVVRSNIEKLGGTVKLDSVVGEGTSVILQLPLTLAIIPSLIVGVGSQRYAIPQVNVEEFVWVRSAEVKDRIERLQGKDVLRLRGMLLPLVRLCETLGIKDPNDKRARIADRRSDDDTKEEVENEGADREEQERRTSWRSDYNIAVIRIGTNRFGIIVDKFFDTEEIVVKPLSSYVDQACKCFSGATILGDGRVITILDVGGIATLANLVFADLESEEKRRQEEEEKRAALIAQTSRSVILFNIAESEYFAVPQDSVLRLESIHLSDIEFIGDKEFIQYRGHGLPIVRFDQHIGIQPLSDELEKAFLLIPKMENTKGSAEAAVGLLVSKIIDARDVEVDLQGAEISGPGVSGSAIVGEKLTTFIDLEELLDVVTVD